jgi:hypothetical protein
LVQKTPDLRVFESPLVLHVTSHECVEIIVHVVHDAVGFDLDDGNLVHGPRDHESHVNDVRMLECSQQFDLAKGRDRKLHIAIVLYAFLRMVHFDLLKGVVPSVRLGKNLVDLAGLGGHRYPYAPAPIFLRSSK